jgi:hypothetical protein
MTDCVEVMLPTSWQVRPRGRLGKHFGRFVNSYIHGDLPTLANPAIIDTDEDHIVTALSS